MANHSIYPQLPGGCEGFFLERLQPNCNYGDLMKHLLAPILGLVLLACVANAQDNFSIPVDNWSYDDISALQTRGFLLDLSPGFKPYRRLEVANALINLEKKVDVSSLPASTRWLLEKLDSEFSGEMGFVRAESQDKDTTFTGARFSEEAKLNLAKGNYSPFKYASDVKVRPFSRSEFGFSVGNHLTLYTDGTIDQTLNDDTLYTGSLKYGLRALHQQAYVEYSDKYVDATFGRDYLSWGYGNNGKILVSTTAGAFDLASLFVKTSVMKFNWFVAQLDQLPYFTPDTNDYSPYGPTPTAGLPDPLANRYFTGSRFEFDICNKVFLGAFEAATFGGPDAPIDLGIIDPLRVTYEIENNDHKDLNSFLGSDISVFLPANLNLYSDLLLDDWQVDKKTKSDLKPNLYAFDVGISAADILSRLGVEGTDANIQYRIVRNRVYNEYNWLSYEKLILRNYPIADPYGDDYWNLDLRLSHWLSFDWKLGVEIMHLEHGSSNIWSFYDMPWLTDPNVTLQTGYNEPFPYGTVQVTNQFEATALYQPHGYYYAEATAIYSWNHNYMYVPGQDKGAFSFVLTIYYNFVLRLPFE